METSYTYRDHIGSKLLLDHCFDIARDHIGSKFLFNHSLDKQKQRKIKKITKSR